MRSVTVVLPASICAAIPIFLIFFILKVSLFISVKILDYYADKVNKLRVESGVQVLELNSHISSRPLIYSAMT